MRYRILALVAALLLVTASLPAAVAGETTLQLDENTSLTDESSIQEWENEEEVTATPGPVLLNITVAHEADSVGLSSWRYSDSKNSFLRVQYNESIERTVRFYVPDDYWPAYAYELEPENGGPTAQLRPIDGGNYTAVTIEFDGQTDAVYKVDRSTAFVFEGRRLSRKVVENKTGISLPTFAAKSNWQRLPEDSMTGDNVAAAINTSGKSVLIQYDDDPAPETESWKPVRDCEEATTDVCRFERDGQNGTVFVMTDKADPPAVRYKVGGGSITDRLFGSLNEFTDIATNVDDHIKEIFS